MQRERKGQDIATHRPPERKGNLWIVPSQSGKGKYTVDLEKPSCTCPDFALRGLKCKHIYAALYTITPPTEALKTITPVKKTTYRQDWTAYNVAQTNEKAYFQALLFDLCQGIAPLAQHLGRPRLSWQEVAFSAAYSGKADLTSILRDLIEESSLCLKSVEVDFAVDASGFSTSRPLNWYNTRYGHEQENHEWMKVHLMCGVKTNIVTSVEITGGFAHDSPQFRPLVTATARHFQLGDVPADKAYSSKGNLELVAKQGGTPYIPFRKNTVEQGDGSTLWEKLWHVYQYHREDFLAHYHKRSNAESTMWMIKSKFGEHIRSKNETAMVNELLCKVLCHNICVVIQSMYELGVEPTLWAETPFAHKVAA